MMVEMTVVEQVLPMVFVFDHEFGQTSRSNEFCMGLHPGAPLPAILSVLLSTPIAHLPADRALVIPSLTPTRSLDPLLVPGAQQNGCYR